MSTMSPQPAGASHLEPTRWLAVALCAAALLGASAAQAAPSARFMSNAMGDEVTDTHTGLIWRRCLEGQSWDGNRCMDSHTTLTWDAALALAQSEASRTGLAWRVPNVKELSSLVNPDAVLPASYSAFSDTPSDWFWTSTFYAGDATDVWVVAFDYGLAYNNYRYNYGAVRLVRTAQ